MLYPRLGIYSGCGFKTVGGNTILGYPFLDANGVLRQNIVDAHARWDIVVAEGQSLLLRPDIIDALRAKNPNIKILAFFALESVYWNPIHSLDYNASTNPNAVNDVWGQAIEALKALPSPFGYIKSATFPGHRFNPGSPGNDISFYDLNLSNPAAVACWANMLIPKVIGSGKFDGIFFDWAGGQAGADTYSGDAQDFAAAGSPPWGSLAAMKTAYIAGYFSLMQQLRAAAPPGFIICANDGGHTKDANCFPFLSGNMRENFPFLSGGQPAFGGTDQDKWEQNMIKNTREQGQPYEGCLGNDHTMLQPPMNWLNTLPTAAPLTGEGGDPTFDVSAQLRVGRFGLASATLCDAIFTITGDNGRIPGDDRWFKWYPAYSVDITTMSPTNGLHKGWLGEAMGAAYQTGEVNLWRRDFRNGTVIVNNKTGTSAGAVLDGTYKKIKSGIAGDTVDVGGTVTDATGSIPGRDALFLARGGEPRKVHTRHRHH